MVTLRTAARPGLIGGLTPFVAVMFAVLACTSDDPPEFVYLRTESVEVKVIAYAEAQVPVGTWLPLRATRTTTGDWRRVPYRDIAAGTPWLGYVPPLREKEVAANLRWYVDPADGATFDALAPRPVPIDQRAVRFSKPGVYRLWATSHAPLDAVSNTLEVRVLPGSII